MKKIILAGLLILLNLTGQAQTNSTSFKELSQRLLQNEMLSQRFFRNFVFIKTNNFKKKALADMDKSLAKFDDNMIYFMSHLPEDKVIRNNFKELQAYWNIYRLKVTDYERGKYKNLISRTKKLGKLTNRFLMDMIEEQENYSKYKKTINIAILDANNIKSIDNIATTYILKNHLKIPASDIFPVNLNDIKKNLKKIGKFQAVAQQVPEQVSDLNNTLESIKNYYRKKEYNPKMMFSFVSVFSKKSYKILDIIIDSIS